MLQTVVWELTTNLWSMIMPNKQEKEKELPPKLGDNFDKETGELVDFKRNPDWLESDANFFGCPTEDF